MNHKPPTPPVEVIRILRAALQRLEHCSEIDGDLLRYVECKRILGTRVMALEAELARTSPKTKIGDICSLNEFQPQALSQG